MPIGLALTTKGASAPTPGAAVFDILASGETVPETALDEAAFINKNLQLLYQQHINELFPTTGDDATSFIEQLQRQADKLATDAAASSVAKDAADKGEGKEEEEDGGSGMDMDMDMDVDMVETATMTVPDEDESIAASESAASSRQKKLKRNLAQQRPPVPNELELKKALAELLHNAQNEAAIALDLVSLIISGNPSSSSSSAPSGQSGQQSTVAAALAARRGAPQQAQQHPQPQLPIPAGIIQSSYLVSGGERSSSAALAERAGLMLSTRVHQFDQIAARLSSATTRIKAAVDRDSRMWNELLEIRNRGWLVYATRERNARFEYKVNYGFLSAGSAHSGNDTALLSRTDNSENKQQNSGRLAALVGQAQATPVTVSISSSSSSSPSTKTVSKFQYSAMDIAINAPNDDDDGDKEEEPTGAEAISNKLTQAQHAVFVEELMDQLATSAWTHGTSVPRDASSTHSVTSTSLSLNTSGSVKLDFSTSNLSAEANCVTNSTEDEEHEDDPWLAQSVLLAAQLRLRSGHRQRIKNRGNHMLPGRTSIPRRIERMVDIVSNDRTASLDSFVTDITRRALVVDAVRDVLHQFANEIERERVQIVHDPTDGSYIAILYAGNSVRCRVIITRNGLISVIPSNSGECIPVIHSPAELYDYLKAKLS